MRPALLLLAALALGCGHKSSVTRTEEARVTNPNGTLDAVVVSDSADEGATGGTTFYKVLVVPKGQTAAEGDHNLAAELTDVGSIKPVWTANGKLLIHLKNARVWRFTNYLWTDGNHLIGVRLLIDGYGPAV
jgi:hypothetical protein